MTRILKDPDVRRQEIVQTAEILFNTKGYDDVPVNMIIEAAGIAKGTFYYYFKSKEEVLDAIVKRMVERIIRHASTVSTDNTLNAIQKIKIMLVEQNREASREFERMKTIHQTRNADLHQKMIVELVLQYAPILAGVVGQGVNEGVFKTKHPLEATEYLLVGSQFLFDPGIYNWSDEDIARRSAALQEIVESAYMAQPGCLGYITELNDL